MKHFQRKKLVISLISLGLIIKDLKKINLKTFGKGFKISLIMQIAKYQSHQITGFH